MSDRVRLFQGDCTEILPTLADASVDAVVTDPPYPEISRDYGRMTEAEWHVMMDTVVLECRRVLKPTGSAVFILQPNSERVGRMRPWLWEFMAKWTKEWGMVQDAYWWNHATPPTVHCHRSRGLMRPSLKACVWLGGESCFRDQDQVVLPLSEASETDRRIDRHELYVRPSGLSMRNGRALQVCRDRGGLLRSTSWFVQIQTQPLAVPGTTDMAPEHQYCYATGGAATSALKAGRFWTRLLDLGLSAYRRFYSA